MKNRKSLITFGFSFLMSTAAMAQAHSIDLGVNVGYGFTAGPQTLVSNTGSTVSAIPYSLGAGVDAGLNFKYMATTHMGIGLSLNYVAGNQVSYTELGNPGVVINRVYQGNLFSIIPDLVITTNNPGLNIYGKFGPDLGVASFTQTSTQSGNRAEAGTNIDTYSGGVAVGLYSALGFSYPLGDRVRINLELFGTMMSYAPMQRVNTQTYDGDQKSPTITYASSIDNTTAADTELKSWYPFSSAGVMIGVSINIAR